MSVAFKPTIGRLLVQNVISKEQTSPSGIIIPASGEPDNKAVVIKTGEGLEDYIGKTISYRDECGRTVKIHGRDYLLLFQNDIDGTYE